jgi:general secretion pathway protein A
MYHAFFGLAESAFSIAVNPRYLYMSQQHREALAHLLYGIQNGGFVMLTGEVGTGKTTLVRCLLEQLPENTDLAMILNPMASAPELLASICDELRIPHLFSANTKQLTDALNQFLLENHARGRKTVLLIDEAQLLQVPVLEQIRLLTNLETTQEKLLQIMLVGQPELKELLSKPELRQLSQRITARFHLQSLTLQDTQAYLQHRLKVAGMPESQENPFPKNIVKLIHQQSQGIPRLINVLAERLLLGVYAQQKRQVDKSIFDQAVQEITGESPRKPMNKPQKALLQGVLVTAVVLLISWFNKSEVLFDSNHSSSSIAVVSSSSSSESSSSFLSSSASFSFFENYAGLLMKKNPAEQLLMNFSGETTFDLAKPCAVRVGQNRRCQTDNLTSWDQLRELNRPGLLTLIDDNKESFYLLVIGINDRQILVRNHQQERLIDTKVLATYWQGEYTFTWAAPVGFEQELLENSQSPVVTWVAEQFARMDQQPQPLTQLVFTENLKKRLMIFQSTEGLAVTGAIDKHTLQRINLLLGIDSVLTALPENISNQSSSISVEVK